MFFSMLSEAWHGMSANRLRTFLTMLGMVIGVGAVVLMMAIGEGAQQSIKRSIDSMGSNLFVILSGSSSSSGSRSASGSSSTLNMSDAAAIEVRQLAIRVFQALRGEGLARVDFFYEENGRGFLCNEINTMPGFTPISMYPKLWLASGLSYPELIDRLVELAQQRHARRRRNTAH